MDRDGPETGRGPSSPDGVGRGFGGAGLTLELLCLTMLVVAVLGTCALLIAAHRRVGLERSPGVVVAASASGAAIRSGPSEETPIPEPEPPSEPPGDPEPDPMPAAPEDDPTEETLARIAARRAELAGHVDQYARRLAEIGRELSDSARRIEATLAEAREADQRRARLSAEADRLEAELQLVALERDVLEREREAVERHRREEVERPGYAILPYRGPYGTWRRPIPVECRNGMATLEPGGLSFSMMELMAMPGRSGPFGGAVKRLAALLERQGAPGGERVEPYVLFVVRPDGIRPFYEARAALDAIGVPYGYELVDQDWEIEYPAWDDPSIWDALDASMRQDPPSWDALLGEEPGIAGLGGEDGFGGRDGRGLGGDGLDPLGPVPVPGGAARGLVDLLPEEPMGVPGDAVGSGLGPRGPASGLVGGTVRGGPVSSGRPIGPGGGSAVLPVEPDESSAGGLPVRRSGSEPGDVAFSAGPARGEMTDPIPAIPEEIEGSKEAPGGTAPMPSERFGGETGMVAGTGSAGRGRPAGMAVGRGVPGGAGGTGVGLRSGEPGPGRPGIPLPGLDRLAGHGPAAPFGTGREGSEPRSEAGGGRSTPEASGTGGSGSAPGTPAGAGSSAGPSESAAMNGVPANRGGADAAGSPAGSADGAASGRDRSGDDSGSAGPGGPAGADRRRNELVIACGRKGVTIHPGGYRLSEETIKKDDGRLMHAVEAVVAARRRREPASDPVPSVRFVVEPGGYGLYWSARAQLELARPEWPVTWQASQPRTFTIFGSERW